MLHKLILLFTFISVTAFSQVSPNADEPEIQRPSLLPQGPDTTKVAANDQYRIISLERDTTFVDTSLTIQKEYRFNYLRKDIFGLLPFSNEGQTYNTLDYRQNQSSSYPEFGYLGKHFNYLQFNDIKYYSVATPLTELYFKTVMEQGQSLDAFITVNTSEQFNFSVAYKGLRSSGKYINQLSSTGNFRFTTSYHTKNKRYFANAHFTSQDMLNGENGGITNIEDFESGDDDFKNRARINVFLNDASSTLIGKRIFVDHNFRINKTAGNNNLYITHQFNFEYKYFEYRQRTLLSDLGENQFALRFGPAYVAANINDQVRYNRMYNKVGAVYENALLGKFTFFAEDYRYNYFYNRILVLPDGPIVGALDDQIASIGGQYEYRKDKWRGNFLISNSVSNTPMSTIDGKLSYDFNQKNTFSFRYEYLNKLPNLIYNLHQSSFIEYNWYNSFSNEKISNFTIEANTQWLSASATVSSISDKLYFSDDSLDPLQQIITPKQYGESINYLAVQLKREFKFRKFALDNTILYQQTDQTTDILNVPKLITRNTIYFTDYFFKKALYLQTGITVNYFTEYYANDYNPILGEFFVQNQRKIGNFPMLDFFVNARIKQTRIFFKAEHFNSAITGNNFYAAPNSPYRDFLIRFGLVWNFFK